MSERAAQTFDEAPMEYRQDVPGNELPNQVSEPGRNPGVTQDLASLEARQAEPADEPVEIDMTVGVGEDPGWHRARRARPWRDSADRRAQRVT